MGFFNKVVLLGNVTRNPEVRYVPGRDLAVAKFSLAVNKKHKDKEETMFIDIVAFGKLGEICGEYLTKGSPILVEGRLSQNVWEDSDGKKRNKHEVIAETIQMVGGKRDGKSANNESGGGSDNEHKFSGDFSEDDIPFMRFDERLAW